jgi:hypothetical protein
MAPKKLGIVLIVVTGLLTFHPPHFLLEPGRYPAATGAAVLEIALAVNLLAALIGALGIRRDAGGAGRWAWSSPWSRSRYSWFSTIGLRGLPKNWAEPSRLVSLAVQALFIALAIRQVRHSRRMPDADGSRSSRRRARR